jgi:hypothetical protein
MRNQLRNIIATVAAGAVALSVAACGGKAEPPDDSESSSASGRPPSGSTRLAEASDEFDRLVAGLAEAEGAINLALDEARRTLDSASDADVEDPAVLVALRAAIDEGEAHQAAETPAKGASLADLEEQVAALREAKAVAESLAGRLGEAVATVDQSKRAKIDEASKIDAEYSDRDGYTFRLTGHAPTMQVTADTANSKPGQALLVVPEITSVDWKFTHTTSGKIFSWGETTWAVGDSPFDVLLFPAYSIDSLVCGYGDEYTSALVPIWTEYGESLNYCLSRAHFDVYPLCGSVSPGREAGSLEAGKSLTCDKLLHSGFGVVGEENARALAAALMQPAGWVLTGRPKGAFSTIPPHAFFWKSPNLDFVG